MDKTELIAQLLYKMRGHYPNDSDIMSVLRLYNKFAKYDLKCRCPEEDKHGETSLMCCNNCGKPND